MVIPDTSVWIEYFKGNEPYFTELHQLIEQGSIYTVEVVFAELLQGALNAREKQMIIQFYESLPIISTPDSWIHAGEFSFKEKLVSKGIKLIDAYIISTALRENLRLWTLDKKILSYLDSKYVFTP